MMPPAIAAYPLGAFHSLISDAAQEVARNVQVPDAMVGMSMLTAMSVTCQGLIDVRLPPGMVRPVSLYLMAVANSGDRKTGVDNVVAAPIHALDEEWGKSYEGALAAYKSQHIAWEAVTKGLSRKLAKAAQAGQPLSDLNRELADHLASEPVKPRRRRMVRQNITERAVMEAMAGEGESLGFLTDEGDVIFKGGAMRQLGRLNKSWDGARTIAIDRAHDDSVVAHEPRTTFAVMVQEAVLRDFLGRHGEMLRGSGHLARYLVGAPPSLQGYRHVYSLDQYWCYLPAFHARMTELLQEYRQRIEAGSIQRQILEFSPEAKLHWRDASNWLEETLRQPAGQFSDISDFASKGMEIAGRIAALMHHFTGQEGKISVDTLERALHIFGWHLGEFKRVFSPHGRVPQEVLDTQTLWEYLQSRFFNFGHLVVPKNIVLKNGPLRPVRRMQVALDILVSQGRVFIGRDARRRYFIHGVVAPSPAYGQAGGVYG
jgi:hypothetical protein